MVLTRVGGAILRMIYDTAANDKIFALGGDDYVLCDIGGANWILGGDKKGEVFGLALFVEIIINFTSYSHLRNRHRPHLPAPLVGALLELQPQLRHRRQRLPSGRSLHTWPLPIYGRNG